MVAFAHHPNGFIFILQIAQRACSQAKGFVIIDVANLLFVAEQQL